VKRSDLFVARAFSARQTNKQTKQTGRRIGSRAAKL